MERALAIMKDPRCGSFGVVAIGVDIAVRIVLVGELIVLSRPDLVFWVIALSRAMQALTLTLFPSARTGGTAAPFLPSAGTKVVTMISVVLAAGVVFFLVPLVTASVVVASMILASLLWGGYCMLRIRGITGDCVGAANEISLAVGLAAAVLILQRSV